MSGLTIQKTRTLSSGREAALTGECELPVYDHLKELLKQQREREAIIEQWLTNALSQFGCGDYKEAWAKGIDVVITNERFMKQGYLPAGSRPLSYEEQHYLVSIIDTQTDTGVPIALAAMKLIQGEP